MKFEFRQDTRHPVFELHGRGQHGQRIRYQAGPEKGMVMSVLENNTLTGGRRGILLSAPANWTLLRDNKLEVLDPEEQDIE